jgi:hypothetical protein
VTERPEGELLDVLDAAVGAALVRELADCPGHYSFTHALIQHTLYSDLGSTRRSRTHRMVAEALESIYGDRPGERVGDLAYHWSNATQPVVLEKAVAYSKRAAEAAMDALAPDEAVRYFSQALELHDQQRDPDPLLKVDLVVGLGTAQRQAGQSHFRETLLEAGRQARRLGATDRLVSATLANNRGLFSSLGAVDEEKVAALGEVLAAIPPSDSGERALLLATLCNELTYGQPLAERRELASQAKTMARRLGDPTTIVRVLTLVEQPLEAPSTLDERVADTSEALVLAHELEDPTLLYFAAVYRRITAMQSGEFALSARCLDQMRAVSDKVGQPTLMWITKFHEAAEALLVGDHQRAEVLTLEALQMGTDGGQPDAVTFFGTQTMIVRHQQGRLGEFRPIIESVATETGMPVYLGGVAAAHLDAGEEQRARELLDAAAEDGFASLPVGIGWLDGMIAYAEVATELKLERPAELLVDLLTPFHGQVNFQGLIPFEPLSMYLGGLCSVLGRYGDAETYFVEATEQNASGRRIFAQARTDLAWSRMLLARGEPADVVRAGELLERARRVAAEHGFALVESRAAAALVGI